MKSKRKKYKNEIQPVIEQIHEAAAKVDTSKLYEVLSFAGNDFIYVETSGAFYDKAAYKNMVH